MLEVAQRKLDADPTLKQRSQLIQHDIANLDSCPALEKSSFDLIICSNAFVLLDEREATIENWAEYLKPGGSMVIDIPSEQSIPEGIMMENICKKLGITYMSDRSWVRSKDSFSAILESRELDVKVATMLEKRPGQDVRQLDKAQIENQFQKLVQMVISSNIVGTDFPEKAKPFFLEEWNRLAVNGKIKVCESLYLYIAEKRA